MIEETKKLISDDLESNIEEIVIQGEGAYKPEIKAIDTKVDRTNILFVQLLICSLIVWSVLFLKNSAQGSILMQNVNRILLENVRLAPVEEVIEALTVAVRQIL